MNRRFRIVTLGLLLSGAAELPARVPDRGRAPDRKSTASRTADHGSTTPSLRKKADPNQVKASDTIIPDKVDTALLSKLVLKLTNKQRRKHNLSEVTTSSALAETARLHSRDMAERNFFSHTAPPRGGGKPAEFSDRVPLEKFGLRAAAENIAMQPVIQSERTITRTEPDGNRTREIYRDVVTYRQMAKKTVRGWMKSPGHRKNILTPEFNRLGVGIAAGRHEDAPYIYLTQNFGRQ